MILLGDSFGSLGGSMGAAAKQGVKLHLVNGF